MYLTLQVHVGPVFWTKYDYVDYVDYVEMIYSKFPQHVYMTVAGVMSYREQEWIVISYSVLLKYHGCVWP